MELRRHISPERLVLGGTLLAAAIYLQDLRFDFILDDVPLILMNENVASLRNWRSAFVEHIASSNAPSLPIEAAAIHYRPIYRLWQMLNAQCFGLVIPWWHLTSLLLHIAAVFLVYQVGLKLLKDPWTASLAALLFAAHPIHAESVAYVTASTDLLVAVFTLLSLLMYFRFREGASWPWYLGSIFLAALAMLSKETAIMVPWLIVGYEWLCEDLTKAPGNPQHRWRRFGWAVPFFGIVGAYVAVRTFLFGFNAGPGPGGSRLAAALDIPLVLLVYARNMLLPYRLSFFYPTEWSSRWTVLRGAALLAALVAAAYLWRWSSQRKTLRLLLVWTAILTLPLALGVYTFVRDDWVHDRHMYLVSVPVCLILAALITHSKWLARNKLSVAAGLFALLLVGLEMQLPRFADDVTIYAAALEVAPRSVLAHGYYAESLWLYGRKEEGLREFRLVTELSPESAIAAERYGAALAEAGRDDQALAEFGTALRCVSGRPAFRALLLSEMAQLELKHSKFAEAAAHMSEAVQLAPDMLNYHALQAEALKAEGRDAEAEQAMRVEAAIRKRTSAVVRPASLN